MNDWEVRAVRVPADKADLVRAELVRRLGLDPGQIVAGSLTMHWDSEGAWVRWSGAVELDANQAADILTSALGGPA